MTTPVADAAQLDLLDLVASEHDLGAKDDWKRFHHACLEASINPEQTVSVNAVRKILTNEYGLTIPPRRLSAFWSKASSKDGFLDVLDRWEINDDHAGGNAGKPIKLRRLRTP